MARAPLARLLVLALALVPARAAAQELTGVAVGPEGGPLADVTVVLHRVGAGGSGAFIGTDTTGLDGAFRFALPSADSAIYFAALRYENALYIGPAVAAGSEPVGGYVLSVDPASEAGAVASALAGGPAARPAGGQPLPPPVRGSRSDAGALVLLALLTLAAVVAFLFAAPRHRQLRTRDAVIELARAENALAVGEEDDRQDRSRLQATRDRLRKQLAPRS